LYTPLLSHDKEVQASDIKKLKEKITPTLRKIFDNELPNKKNWINHGQNVLVFEVLKKLIKRLLRLDEAYAPFSLLGLEVGKKKQLYASFKLDDTRTVGLKGIIDRIDMKGKQVRIIDYKTGASEQKVPSIASLFEMDNSRRNKGALQVMWYGWLFKKQEQNSEGPLAALPSTIFQKDVMPALLSTQASFEKNFAPHLILGSGKKATSISSMKEQEQDFVMGLKGVFEEILDEKVPFAQTEYVQRCTHCPYKGICQR